MEKFMNNSILIVDDEPKVVFALQRTLLDEPYDIRFAFDGGKALRILDRDPVKVIISDERMPRLSGIELLSIAKKKHPGVVRIMITGVGDMETAIKAVNLAEVYRLFVKPWNDSELVAALRCAVEKHDFDTGKRKLPKPAAIRKPALERMKRRHAEIAKLDRDDQGNILIPEFSEEEIAGLLARLEIKMF
jgi:DNA-binding NtrC family response regulator